MFLLKLFLILSCWSYCQAYDPKQNTTLFNTIGSVHEFARTNQEYPLIDNNNWHNPYYTSTYKKTVPGIFSRFTQWIGLSHPLWNASYFQKILSDITKQREMSGYACHFIQKMTPHDGDQFILFWGLERFFHSLARDVDLLIYNHYLDTSLQLIKPNYHLVFNGNVTHGSPYILETLTLIVVLIQKNPSNSVFFSKVLAKIMNIGKILCWLKNLKIKLSMPVVKQFLYQH